LFCWFEAGHRSPQKASTSRCEAGRLDAALTTGETYRKMIRFANNKISVSKAGAVQTAEIYVNIKGGGRPLNVRDLVEKPRGHGEEGCRDGEGGRAGRRLRTPALGPLQIQQGAAERPCGGPRRRGACGLCRGGGQRRAGGRWKRVAGSLIYTRSKIRLSTTGGVETAAQSGGIEISVRALAADDATGHFVSVAAGSRDFKPYEAGLRAGEIAKMASTPSRASPGHMNASSAP
jgi:hypothetical protein